jgi:hypothetical protein
MQTPKNMPLPATLSAFFLFPSPSDLERSAFIPTPVPTPIAIIKSLRLFNFFLHKYSFT